VTEQGYQEKERHQETPLNGVFGAVVVDGN